MFLLLKRNDVVDSLDDLARFSFLPFLVIRRNQRRRLWNLFQLSSILDFERGWISFRSVVRRRDDWAPLPLTMDLSNWAKTYDYLDLAVDLLPMPVDFCVQHSLLLV